SEPQPKRCERPEDEARQADCCERSERPGVEQSNLGDERDASERAGASGGAVQRLHGRRFALAGETPIAADLSHVGFLLWVDVEATVEGKVHLKSRRFL